MPPTVLLEGRQLGRVYGAGEVANRVLGGVDVSVLGGEVLVIAGPSGSGKTTLLSLLGLVLEPTEGEIWLQGQRVDGSDLDALARLRLGALGFVFQQFNLLSGLSALDNVALPLTLAGRPAAEREARARAALARVGLAAHTHKKPRQLSGGQQQRVAIARAIVTDPRVLLCDEPTASLDTESGRLVLDLIRELVGEGGRAAVIVTHDERVVRIADRVVDVADGRAALRATPTQEPS